MSHEFGSTSLPRFEGRTLRIHRYDLTSETHIAGVDALLAQDGPVKETESVARRAKAAVAASTNILVGEVLGEIVAVVFTVHNRSRAHLWNFIVHVDYQNKGIGTAFLGLVLSVLEKREVIVAGMEVVNPTPAACALLAKHYFTADSPSPHQRLWKHTLLPILDLPLDSISDPATPS